jgi:glycosyltransferase involved in cell wall biosynthesis
VFHRYSQLQRTLETLCRQEFKDFEVLIYDNQDDQNIAEVVVQFLPYLNVVLYKEHGIRERRFDPTYAFNYLFPHTKGAVVAIMQPECMLHKKATWWLYYGHMREEGVHKGVANFYSIENALEAPIKKKTGETCVTLKTLWSSPRMQGMLDGYDWHSGIQNLYEMPQFWIEGCGLACFSNQKWKDEFRIQIWWLVFSFRRKAKVWKDMPSMYGHAAIDFFLIRYRDVMKYIDIMPYEPMAFHQDHHRMSVSPIGEQDELTTDKIRERYCK